MLRSRLLAAAAILGPLLLLIWLDDQFHGGRPGIWLVPLTVLISLLAGQEINELIRRAQLPCSGVTNLAAIACVTVCSSAPVLWLEYPSNCPLGKPGMTLMGLTMAVWLVFLAELVRYREPGESLIRVAGGCLGALYIGLSAGFLIQLRLLGPGREGFVAVITTILVVKLADVGAYFVGKASGRHKLTRVSPGKTLEGLVGGLVFAMLAAGASRATLLPWLLPGHDRGSLRAYLLFGASLVLAGLLGDLAESLLKRDAHQKESSAWMPGLGGVMDVIDSLLAAAPVSFLWWVSGWL